MTDHPRFLGALVPRCFASTGDPNVPICGQIARWRSPAAAGLPPACFCDAHRPLLAELVVGEQLVRRVRVTLVVDLAGAAIATAEAKSEAVDRLYRLVEDAGGVMNLATTTSDVGLVTILPAEGAAGTIAGRG